ncbi:MAG TPA: hypothetical protein DEF61_05440 [Firmicutes bacterium]|nr:hypothetical protein [Bacillota bacterium]HBX25668.1 hypothetical protein [Bacillota bacterium]
MNLKSLKNISKAELISGIKNILLVILGSFILAFGNAAFLIPFNLITGGVSSIGIIIQYFLDANGVNFQIVDIVTWSITALLFVVGLIFMGKKFSAHTLLASILYPGFLSILYRFELLSFISASLENQQMLGRLLAGIFGGIFVGLGVAITFKGHGSTGGLDILCAIIAKYTPIKESISSLTFDSSIVLIGIICLRNEENIVPLGLIGILSALIAGAMIEIVYVASSNYVICDIISSRYKEIVDYIQVDMDRGCTIIDTVGGYTGENRKLVRVALSKKEAQSLKGYIGKLDERAFVVFTNASAVNGEGFFPFFHKKKCKKDEEK